MTGRRPAENARVSQAHTIASLYARRRRLVPGLADFDRRAAVYCASIAEVEAELAKLVLFVPTLVRRRAAPCLPAREGSRATMACLRDTDRALTVREIVGQIIVALGLTVTEPQHVLAMEKRVRTSLQSMRRRGTAVSGPRLGRGLVWRLAVQAGQAEDRHRMGLAMEWRLKR